MEYGEIPSYVGVICYFHHAEGFYMVPEPNEQKNK